MDHRDVSIVIVSFNTIDKLRRCLDGLPPESQIIVVDNASEDGSAQMVRTEFPQVHLIESAQNLGFGPANNLGHNSATRDLVLYLNSDAYAQPGSLDLLAQAMEDPTTAAVGGRLLNPDRSLQWSTAKTLTLWHVFTEQVLLDKILSKFGPGYWTTAQITKTDEVDQLMGACLMVRRDNPERFDDRFFLYCEDTDLCKRLRRHGKLMYVPEAEFTHDLGSSSNKNRWLAVARYNLGKELYFQIHHGAVASAICRVLNRFGALLRLIAWTLIAIATLGRKKAQVELFWRVLTAKSKDLDPRKRQA